MPSKFEPCGLNQMYSLRYGTPPIVRKTGGLADTVEPFNPATGQGTGFVFEHFTPAGLAWALDLALNAFHHPILWRRIMGDGMTRDFSWDVQGREYVELYGRLAASPFNRSERGESDDRADVQAGRIRRRVHLPRRRGRHRLRHPLRRRQRLSRAAGGPDRGDVDPDRRADRRPLPPDAPPARRDDPRGQPLADDRLRELVARQRHHLHHPGALSLGGDPPLLAGRGPGLPRRDSRASPP